MILKRFPLLVGSLFAVFSVLSCKESEVDELKKENEELKDKIGLTRADSAAIYEAVNQNIKRKYAVFFLDSLKKADVRQYEALIEEAEARNTFLLGD